VPKNLAQYCSQSGLYVSIDELSICNNKKICFILILKSRNSVVGTETSLRAWQSEFRIPAHAKDFFPPRHPGQPSHLANSASGCFPGAKGPEWDVGYVPQSSVEFKSGWNYTFSQFRRFHCVGRGNLFFVRNPRERERERERERTFLRSQRKLGSIKTSFAFCGTRRLHLRTQKSNPSWVTFIQFSSIIVLKLHFVLFSHLHQWIPKFFFFISFFHDRLCGLVVRRRKNT